MFNVVKNVKKKFWSNFVFSLFVSSEKIAYIFRCLTHSFIWKDLGMKKSVTRKNKYFFHKMKENKKTFVRHIVTQIKCTSFFSKITLLAFLFFSF